MAEQIEKAYQKQHLFQNAKNRGGKKVATKEKRWYKDVGLGFKTPAEAITGTYIDKKCPFTGDVSIRGRILTGRVVSTKMTRTIIIRRDYLHYIPKYNRYEKRHKNLAAHVSPAFRVEIGDVVTVGQCRPLSKTVRFNVLRVAKNKAAAKTFGKARLAFYNVGSIIASIIIITANDDDDGIYDNDSVASKLAPTLLSVFASRLSRSRPQSPQPGSPSASSQGLPMGQPQSKSKKKNSKDKDKDPAAESTSPPDPAANESNDNTPQGSLSRTAAQQLAGSSPLGKSTDLESPLQVNVTDVDEAAVVNGAGRPADGSPSSSSSVSPNAPTTNAAPSGSPLPSSSLGNGGKPAPLDIPPYADNPFFFPGDASYTGKDKNKFVQLDIDDMIQRLLDVGYTGKAAREVFLNQPTLIELSPPVKIVGDVHGQYSDLIRLFEMCGFPPASNYLFLGDYVDRGKQSLETILLLLCYKIKYPENFFLLRGNHECANVTRVYGFYDECKRRCNIKTWKTFIDVFNCLPIAAIVASKIFCVHGGLSPSLHHMDDIKRIQRPTDVPDYGLLNDLLWSDPSDTAADWEDNERGVSYCFGKAPINDFLVRYDMDLICRAHMVVEDGYEFWNDRTLVTVFSAPNYCGEFDNYGACMSVSEELLCAFELLKPLDGPALRKEMTKAKRKSMMATTT
ncbi:hypothetical protein NM688_g697 [Phlebia brevispora]|uniref:Uncharacterized protein n=1 Tax=Phlebia brevispora TaxID=194682 RepID=A0ACC1TDL4_9APHY|nr:hypothetical protein NM688_g697 [Phlebia brevispora]